MNATVEFVSRFGSCGSSVSTGTGVGVQDLRDLVGRDVVRLERGPDPVGDHGGLHGGLQLARHLAFGEEALAVDQHRVHRTIRERGLGGVTIRDRPRADVGPLPVTGLHDQRAESCRTGAEEPQIERSACRCRRTP